MKQSTGGQIWIFCWMLTVFIISKSSLDMLHSNQIQILAYCRFTLTRTVRVWICSLSGIWILEDMNYNIFILWKHYGIIWMNNIHSNWDSICPKPWKGFAGCWHCFISWHMRCYHVILFYNNFLFYFILFFMCITFHSFKKNALKNVIFCALELVRPFKKHREVLTNSKVFPEIHWQWNTSFQLHNNFFYSYTLKVF